MTLQRLAGIGLLVSTLLTALPLALAGSWILALAALLLPLLWLGARRRGWPEVDNLLLAALTLLALLMLAREATAPAVPLAALSAALVAWAAAAVGALFDEAGDVPDREAMERRIVRRLLLIGGLGLGMGLLAVVVRLNVSFGLAMLLALLAVLGLARAVTAVRELVD